VTGPGGGVPYSPKKKLGPDISIRLGKKVGLKPKLDAIAERNGISANDLIIYIIEWFLESRTNGQVFTVKIK